MQVFLDAVSNFAAWLRRHRRLGPSEQPLLLNLGAGLTVAPGWTNVDASLNALLARSPLPLVRAAYRFSGARHWYAEEDYCRILRESRFVHHNLRYGIPFTDDSAEAIYSSHLLEHLDKSAGVALIDEAFRVLRPGGVIRLVVPDMDFVLSLWERGSKEEALEYFFTPPSTLGQHKYMYDSNLLSGLLESAGFVEARICQPGEGEVPDLELLDLRPRDSLHIEARKPRT